MREIAPLEVHFLISLILVVRAVSSTAQWKTLRPVDMVEGFPQGNKAKSKERQLG